MFEKFEFKPRTSPLRSYKTQEGKSAIKKVFGKKRSEKMGKSDDSDEDVDVANHASIDSSKTCRQERDPIVIQDSDSDDERLKSINGHKNTSSLQQHSKETTSHTIKNKTPKPKRKRIKQLDSDSDCTPQKKQKIKSHKAESSPSKNNNVEHPEGFTRLKEMFPDRSETDMLFALERASHLAEAAILLANPFWPPKDTEQKTSTRSDSESDAHSSPQKKQKSSSKEATPTKSKDNNNKYPDGYPKLKNMFPDRSQKDIENALEQTNHIAEAAIFLSNPYWPPNDNSSTIRREIHLPCGTVNIDSDDEEDEIIDVCDVESTGSAHDDDDDDEDFNYYQPKQTKILSFLNDCLVEELALIPGLSEKKAEKLVSIRPFESWEDLEIKLQTSKGISKNLLENAYDVIKRRNDVQNLMQKCEKISEEIGHLLSGQTNEEMAQPASLNSSCQLKPYQLVGLNWLKLMHGKGMNCILADEMGLGKTVQALSFIAHLIEEGDDGPYLIIAPASTVDNWVRELEHFYPDVKYIQYYGSQEERFDIRCSIKRKELDFQVVIATYQTAISTFHDRNLFCKELDIHYVVFDEGHMLKNMQSQRYQKLFKIKARRRLLLTGTPMQNDLLELMSLLSFVMPKMFGTCEISEGLNMLFSFKKSGKEKNVRSYNEDRLQQASRILKPFVLRRLKRDVLSQLPQKTEEVVMVDLTEKQRQVYDKVFTECYNEYKLHSGGNRNRNIMMPLRLSSNHSLLLRQHYDESKLHKMATKYCRDFAHQDSEVDLVFEDMTVMSDFELNRLCLQEQSLTSFALDKNVILDSGKFNYLKDTLPEMKKKGDRVLLFSQFVLVMDIIEAFLKHHKYKFLRLDGSTKVSERLDLIDQFNNDDNIFIFLLSTRAGGLGINLATANVVILHDIDFNPYNDKQAEDRCHRVGQTRDVRVYKLVCKDTIEEAILRCAKSKLKLEQDVVESAKGLEQDQGLELGESEDAEKDATTILQQTFKM